MATSPGGGSKGRRGRRPLRRGRRDPSAQCCPVLRAAGRPCKGRCHRRLRRGRRGMFLPQRGRMSAQLTGEGETACSIRRQLPPFLPHPSAASPGASAPTARTSSGASRHLPRVRGRHWAAEGGILRRLSKAWSVARFPRVGMLLRMTARGPRAIPNELRTPQFRMHPLAPEPGKDLHGEGESAIIQTAH